LTHIPGNIGQSSVKTGVFLWQDGSRTLVLGIFLGADADLTVAAGMFRRIWARGRS
jgi:hypothetical protein